MTVAARIAFAANASYGVGGQGEFLRLMVHALASRGGGAVYSRSSPSAGISAIDLPFHGTSRAVMFRALQRVPLLRGRTDWLTLVADLDFDTRVAGAIDPPDLFDGITGQCFETVRRLRRGSTRVIVTSLNTHINHLARTLDEERRRVGDGRSFVHLRMRERALGEIAAADHLRVNSHLAKRTFVEEGVPEEKITVIHPGVDLAHFHPVPKPDDTFRVLAVSSIDLRKGIHYLFEAFERARLPNAELVIIGGTGDRWSRRLLARHQSSGRAVVCGSVDIMTTSVAETFGPASVLVHPAIEDGYGLVIPQALASGRPVIATRTSGAAELIRHGETGFIVDARSVPQLIDALRTLAADRALWSAMCARARPSVEHLSYDAFARQVNEMYERGLRPGRGTLTHSES